MTQMEFIQIIILVLIPFNFYFNTCYFEFNVIRCDGSNQFQEAAYWEHVASESLDAVPAEVHVIVDELIYPDPVPNVWEECLYCDYWVSFGGKCDCHFLQGDGR